MAINTVSQKATESGILRFDGALISYASERYGAFSVPLSDVAVIGEFTTDNGPFIDDWFLVFVPQGGGTWFEASMYAEGIEAFRGQLSSALGAPICGGLFGSTDFASAILWPEALADRPLFIFRPVTATNLFRRLKFSLLPEMAHDLSPDVLTAIGRSV